MNINLSSFKKIFSGITSRFKKARGRSKLAGRNPERDWERMIIIAAILFVLIFAAGALFFYLIYTGEIFRTSASPQNPVELFHREDLDRAANFYDQKQNAFSEIEATSSSVVDPSS